MFAHFAYKWIFGFVSITAFLFIISGSGPSAGPGGEIASSLAYMEMVAGSATGHRGLCQENAWCKLFETVLHL